MLIVAVGRLTGGATIRGQEHLHQHKRHEVLQDNDQQSFISRGGAAGLVEDRASMGKVDK